MAHRYGLYMDDRSGALFPSERCVIGFVAGARPKRNTKAVGIVSELVAMQRFAAAGFLISVPFGDCAPYDFLLDNGQGRIYRLQVKTGRLRNGVVHFNCYSSHSHRNAQPTRYTGMIDAFAVHCPDNGEFYVVPIDAMAVTKGYASLRVAAPMNNVRKTIKWAKDYRFCEMDFRALTLELISTVDKLANGSPGAAGED